MTVYCDMGREECGGGGWTRVASYNYSDPSISCPTTWSQITDPFRGCASAGAVKTLRIVLPPCFLHSRSSIKCVER